MITSGNVTSGALRTFIENASIRQFKKSTYFYDMGEQRTLAAGDHKYDFNLSDAMTVSSTALTEGVTPAGTSFTFSQVEVTTSQFGDFALITDIAAKDNPFPLVEEAAWELGRRFAEIVDAKIQTTLLTGTNTIIKTIADVTTTRAALVAADKITAKRFAEAFAFLKGKAAPTIGSDYVAVIHPSVQYDLFNDTSTGGFIELAKYQNADKFFNGEIGKLFGCRIVVAPNLKAVAGTAVTNVYPSFIMGAKAYAVVTAQSIETIVSPFGSEGSADPLKQRMSVGIKTRFGSALLKQDSLIRVESSSSLG